MLFTMKNGALFLLIILLLGLVLCSVLGGNCNRKEGFGEKIKEKTGVSTSTSGEKTEHIGNVKPSVYENYENYDHYNGSSIPTTYYGPNGGTATVRNENGNYSVLVTHSNGSTTLYTTAVNQTTASTTSTSTSTSTNNVNESSRDSVTKKTFHGPNGETAYVYMGPNGEYVVKVVDQNGNIGLYSSLTNSAYTNSSTTSTSDTSSTNGESIITKTIYYGENGGTAKVVKNSSTGQYVIEVTGPNGEKAVYSSLTNTIYTNGTAKFTDTIYYGANGGQAVIVTNENGEYIIKVTDSYGNVVVYSSKTNTAYTNTEYTTTTSEPYYYNGTNYNTYTTTTTTTDPYYNASAGAVTGPYGNTAYYATGPKGNTVAGVSTNGIPASAIPPGDEDLYILKSQIVPPVCPACPSSSTCPRQEPCPACPACARCPEPAFECKKVPNYNNINDNYLPMPVLNDFSTFGM